MHKVQKGFKRNAFNECDQEYHSKQRKACISKILNSRQGKQTEQKMKYCPKIERNTKEE